VIRIANANMSRANPLGSTERGYDWRSSLLAYGGAGPLHAIDVAAGMRHLDRDRAAGTRHASRHEAAAPRKSKRFRAQRNRRSHSGKLAARMQAVR
jgi:N-methylhydantoinase A/oxoprolinase/acetone carboxylase beta subunit